MSDPKTIWLPADVVGQLETYHRNEFGENSDSVPIYRSINRLLRASETKDNQ